MTGTRRDILGGLAATVMALPVKAAPRRETGGPIILEARKSQIRLAPAPADPTTVWAYNHRVPGPLLRIAQGAELHVRLVNMLDQPSSLCWHGVRIANAMDGVAGLTQAPVKPGESFDYKFTLPDAGLYWYHPHVFPDAAEQIGRGLYGLLVVDEPDPPQVDHDLILAVNDWTLDAHGQVVGNFLDKEVASRGGRIGPLVTFDGAPTGPFTVRPRARIRLRLLNACSARIAILSLAGMSATVVAVDGQTSELFPPASGTLPIGPGARFELIVDMPGEPGQTPAILMRGDHKPDSILMTFTTKGTPLPAREPVVRLPENSRLPSRIPLEKSLKRDLVLGGGADPPPDLPPPPAAKKKRAHREKAKTLKSEPEVATAAVPSRPGDPKWIWAIDGVGSDGFSGEPLFKVKAGDAVTLAFINRTAFVQQMHVHGHVFRVLHDLDDGWDPYWRESILVGVGKTKHVAFIADNPGKWAVESAILDRQVTGLAGWFEVA